MRTVIWSTDTHDYVPGRRSKDITKYVLKTVHPGSIVLMHDGGGDRSATVKALPDIIKGLRKKGYTLVAIPRAGWEPGPGALPSSPSPSASGTPTKTPSPAGSP
jgi:peptidoglycan/xylan/chitin deacetylase (PgdA/CDA1 family)